MGNVQVQYKQRRGANEAGEDITDPVDYLKELLIEDYNTTKGLYDSLPDDQKTQFRSFFDDEDVLESKTCAEMWMNTYEEDMDTINTSFQGVKGYIDALKA